MRTRETSALGELIHDRRIAYGMSQEELAETLGISVRTVQHAEYGDRIDGRNLKKISKWFDMPLEELADMMQIRIERTW